MTIAGSRRRQSTLHMLPILFLGAALLGGLAPAGTASAESPKAPLQSLADGTVLRVDHSGKVDRSFNKVKIGLTDGVSYGASVTLNKDSSLTLVGRAGAWRDSGASSQLLRVDASGKVLDTGFQVAPEVAEVIKLSERAGLDPTPWHPQPDTSIIISTPFKLIRLTPTGALDPDFTSPTLKDGDMIANLANATEGRLWMTVVSTSESTETLRRINADGSIDGSFKPFKVPGANGYTIPGSGYNDVLAYDRQVLRRIAADGSVDPSFSYKRRDLGAIARLPRGRTLIEWNKDPRRVSHLAILQRNGSVDRSFRFRNPERLWVNTVIAQGRDLVVQGSKAGVRPRLFRIKPSGSIDRTFRAPRMWVDDWVVQPDGRILVAGRNAENPKTKPGFVIRLL